MWEHWHLYNALCCHYWIIAQYRKLIWCCKMFPPFNSAPPGWGHWFLLARLLIHYKTVTVENSTLLLKGMRRADLIGYDWRQPIPHVQMIYPSLFNLLFYNLVYSASQVMQHIQGCDKITVRNNVCDIMYSIMDYEDTKNYITDNPKRKCRITDPFLEFYVSHCSPLHLNR